MKKDFNVFVGTLKNSIKTWGYFVNWKKVFENKSKFEISLNKLNYLLGKEDLESEFYRLFEDNPDVVKVLPTLLAIRENNLEIYNKFTKDTEVINFTPESKTEPSKYYRFINETGLVKLFNKNGVKNLVDYVLGVEVGLDSNGRKNRGGSLMEEIVEVYLKEFCEKRELEFIAQARPSEIFEKWGVKIRVDKTERSFDFAIFNPKNGKLKVVETNFYNGGGSKLKAVNGEFRGLFDELKPQGIDFIWITDGLGWRTALRPLEETYNHNDYIFNLTMIENGILDNLLW